MSGNIVAQRLLDPFEFVHRGVIHAALEAIITVDDGQRIVMINPAAQRMFGCTATDALGSELSRFIPERLRAAHAAHIRRFDESGLIESPGSKRGHIVGLRANGEEFPLEASLSRVEVLTPQGPRSYFTALLRDLTEMQAMRSEIDALNRRMRGIFELAPIAIWITNADRIVFANHACAELFGAPNQATLVGRSIYSLLEPESHSTVRAKVNEALVTGRPVPMLSERIARLDGTVREVEIAVASLPDHDQTAVQMVITDITERSHASEQLKQSQRELRRLSANLSSAREEERRRIARELHDELGQRLTALKMDLSTLTSAGGPVAARNRIDELLEMVDETVVAVRRIATELRPLMLDDLGLIAAIEWLAHESGRRMGIDIELQLGEADPPIGDAARIALYRMVQEALTNIARHAQATSVRIGLRCSATELELTVHDNGVGFSSEAMHREGSHGLVGIRERAHMLGGQLTISGPPGGGLTVRLPLLAADESTRTDAQGQGSPALGQESPA